MLLVSGKVRLSSPITQDATVAMEKMIHASNLEESCIEYAYSVDILDSQIIRVTEKWSGKEALAKHFQTAHMKEWLQFLETQPLESTDISMMEGELQPISL